MGGPTDALIAYPINKALDLLIGVAQIILFSKSEGKELKEKLLLLKAVIKKIIEEISKDISKKSSDSDSLPDRVSKDISKKSSDSDSLPDRVKQYEDFQADLNDGLHIVDKLEKTGWYNIVNKYRYGKQVLDFYQKIKNFIDIQGSPYVVHDLQKLTAAVTDLERLVREDVEKSGDLERLMREDVEKSRDLERLMREAVEKSGDLERLMREDVEKSRDLERLMQEGVEKSGDIERLMREDVIPRLNSNPIYNTLIVQHFNTIQPSQPSETFVQQSTSGTFQDPAIREIVVGLDNPIDVVRQNLLQEDVKIVQVTGMAGSGKTTLALALRNDLRIKDSFNVIIFITVSQLDGNPNGILDILNTMWDKIVRGPRPRFRGIDDAHRQLQENLMLRTNWRTLVILDDVWSESNAGQLLFEAKGYKTIVTTRQEFNTLKKSDTYLYKMHTLEEKDALSLFCFWAFHGKSSIPSTEREALVKEVAAQCGGLPLALRVIGSCLRDRSHKYWKDARDELRRAKFCEDYHKEELLDRLETSINTLNEEQKDCFLDLGAFPQGGKFCVDSLLDIWVYVRGMKRTHAYFVLFELVSRNLLDLTGDSRDWPITYSCASELYFSQHGVMRDLALRLANHNSHERLFSSGKADTIRKEWRTLGDRSSRARFLSIHTGVMQKEDWCQIDFPEVEALGLFFASSEYCLPTFLHTMPKLKVLIIYNNGSQRARLSGLPSFPSLVQIRSVLLNKLIVPPLYENCKSWERLEKLHVCLCEGLGNSNLVHDKFEALNFPNVIEINLDHCIDLEGLPIKLCSLTSLKRLSITNCHLVPSLPDDLGRLSSLKVLRLSACPSLSRLPLSICKLRKLEYLDISLCSGLQDLPTEFSRLSMLETLDMRECSKLKNLPAFSLSSLKHLIISDDKGIQKGVWKSTNPNLNIHVVPEHFSLEWLGVAG